MASSPGSPSRRSRGRSNTLFEVTTKDLLCVFLALSFCLVAYNTVGGINQSHKHYIASGSKLRHHTEEIVSHLEQIRTLAHVENGKQRNRAARLDGATVSNKKVGKTFCCQAMTAACMSCKLGEEIGTFCSKHRDIAGCSSSSKPLKQPSNLHAASDSQQEKLPVLFPTSQQSAVVDVPFEPAKRSLDDFEQFCKTHECTCHSDIKKGNPTFFGVRPSNLCPGELKTSNHTLKKGKFAYVSLYVGPSMGGRGADACHKIKMCSEKKWREDSLVTMLKVLQHSLKVSGAIYPFVVLVPEGTAEADLEPFKKNGIAVRVVKILSPPASVSATEEKKFHKQSYTKLSTFSLFEYEKVVYLDADMVVGRNLDFLFEAETPAFIVQATLKFSANDNGAEVNRISAPMHAGLMVIEPSRTLYNQIVAKIPHIDSFDGGDTGFMWSFLPMYYELPQDIVRIKYGQFEKPIGTEYHVLHYVGNKPLTCGRAMDCNRNIDTFQMVSFYAPKWHNLWWAWHDHMVLTQSRTGGEQCRDDISEAITSILNQINYCYDGMGNLGSLVNLRCSQSNKSQYVLEFKNQNFLEGTCKENGEGPSHKMFVEHVGQLFGNLPLKAGKITNKNFQHTFIDVAKTNVASFLRTNIITKPDSIKVLGPIIFWWETEKGKDISVSTARIMHAAIKSAILHSTHGSRILIFSNTLPTDFFCESSKLNGWEALKALPFTCRATVLKYKIEDLLSTVPEALDGINSTIVNVKAADDDDKGYMHTMSDLVRFCLLYRYGGTYMDFDQLFLRKLPEDKLPLISREKIWNASLCDNPESPECAKDAGCFAKSSYCVEIGSDKAIPAIYAEPSLGDEGEDLVFSLYSGLLAGFEPSADLLYLMIIMVPQEYRKFCWGCLGPNLVTKAFAQLAKKLKKPPAFTLPSDDLLMVKHGWKNKIYSNAEFLKSKGAVVDVDFHTKKAPKSMLSELIKMTLFAGNGYKDHDSLLELFKADDYERTTAKDVDGNSAHLESTEFAKLPWVG